MQKPVGLPQGQPRAGMGSLKKPGVQALRTPPPPRSLQKQPLPPSCPAPAGAGLLMGAGGSGHLFRFPGTVCTEGWGSLGGGCPGLHPYEPPS